MRILSFPRLDLPVLSRQAQALRHSVHHATLALLSALRCFWQPSHNQYWEQDTFSAWGSYSAFKYGFRYRDEVVGYIRQMQIKLVEALNRMPFPVKATLPEATFLLWVDFRGTGWSQDEIQRFLVEDAGLGFNRGDSFGANGTGFVRINCAVPESRIDEAIQRLSNAFGNRYATR